MLPAEPGSGGVDDGGLLGIEFIAPPLGARGSLFESAPGTTP